jgi:hypothetical protein
MGEVVVVVFMVSSLNANRRCYTGLLFGDSFYASPGCCLSYIWIAFPRTLLKPNRVAKSLLRHRILSSVPSIGFLGLIFCVHGFLPVCILLRH